MIQQLLTWFGDDGLPILAFSGYASQTYVDQVIRRVQHDNLKDSMYSCCTLVTSTQVVRTSCATSTNGLTDV